MQQQKNKKQPKRKAASSRQPAPRPNNRKSKRYGILLAGFFLSAFAVLLIFRLYQIQIKDHTVNAEKAAAQHYKLVTEEPRRGGIYDRNGVELAGTTYVHRIGITPKDLYSITKDLSSEEIAQNIALILDLPLDEVNEAAAQKEATYIQLKKDVPRDQAETLRQYLSENVIGGVRIDTEPRRYYTNGALASQVLGFCHYDEGRLAGQLGVELMYDSLLTGQPGYTYVETDNYGNKGVLPFSVPTSLRAKQGSHLYLTLDINIQKIVQEELLRAIEQYDIQNGGEVVVMDPYSGDLLAMASYPYFSSTDPTACPPGQDAATWDDQNQDAILYLSEHVWRNRAISDSYEPGSTMKALTLSMVLEEELADEKTMVVCQPLGLYNWTINCVKKGGHGEETLEMGFWRSCNPVFAQLALNTGLSRFYQYIHAFGLMEKTGINLPGEETGLIHNEPTDLDMATFAFGESSTVTPIQMATAYCVFANGGKLVRPNIFRMATDADGSVVSTHQPETVRQVISEKTALRVKELLKGVVLYGTGSTAYLEGYNVAGKTSTSTDDFGDHTLSFIGMAPADNPQIVVLVVLNKPQDRTLTSKVAARTCSQIISDTLEYLGVDRKYSESDVSSLTEKKEVPDVGGLTLGEAISRLSELGLRGESEEASMGEETIVRSQWPAAGTKLHNRGLVLLYPDDQPEKKEVVIPDFSGRTVQECFTLASQRGINILINGSCLGIVVDQDPKPPRQNPDSLPEPTVMPAETDDQEPKPDNEIAQPQAPAPIYRGDVVALTFAVIEEELAQSGVTE